MKQGLLILIVTFLSDLNSWSQSGNLGILSESSLFSISLNNSASSQEDSIFIIKDLTPEMYTIDITTSDSIKCSKKILITKGKEQWFELKKGLSGNCKLYYYNESNISEYDTITPTYSNFNFNNGDLKIPEIASTASPSARTSELLTISPNNLEAAIDSAALDSISFIPVYKGRIGCASHVKSVSSIINKINNEELSSRKLYQGNRFLKSNCVSVEQLSEIMTLIEYEDQKLELLNNAKGHVYDLDRMKDLNSQFVLKNSREKFNLILNK